MFGRGRQTWVCAPCRWTVKRRYVWDLDPVCPTCRTTMVNMGTRFKVPRRGDDDGWADATQRVWAQVRHTAAYRFNQNTRDWKLDRHYWYV